MILKLKWMAVACLASRLVPIEARTAVIQVPIFCPNNTYTAPSKPITPLAARACKIPTEAELDWIKAVNPAPTKIPTNGFEKCVTNSTNSFDSLNGIIAVLIIFIPIKRIPKPAIICPISVALALFVNIINATPIKATNGAMALTSNAINWPVIVVPTLAPIIIHTACCKVIICALTNPTTITVVALELWITAVTSAPTMTPKNRFEVNFSKICFKRSPAAASRPFPIICIPYRNKANPPNKDNIFVVVIFSTFSYFRT